MNQFKSFTTGLSVANQFFVFMNCYLLASVMLVLAYLFKK